MANKPQDNAEYIALQNSIAADRRYRRFRYIWSAFLLLAFFCFAIWLSHDATDKAANVVENTAKVNNKFIATVTKENIRYTTCLLVINPNLRSIDIQNKCFAAADLPGGLTREDFSPVVIPPTDSVVTSTILTQAQAGVADGSTASSPQPSSSSTSTQPNNVQSTPASTPPSTIRRILDIINPLN